MTNLLVILVTSYDESRGIKTEITAPPDRPGEQPSHLSPALLCGHTSHTAAIVHTRNSEKDITKKETKTLTPAAS